MKRVLFLALALAACQEDVVQATDPVALTADSVGHFCQMALLEHEGPKGQIHLEGLPGAPLFFSQVRDAVAYTRLPEQSHPILAIWVNDMGAEGATWANPGATNWIDANAAHFVIGSDVIGGMGAAEVVPFAELSKAEAFVHDHGGTISSLKGIPDSAVLTPVASGDEDDAEFSNRLKALSQKSGG